MLYIISSVAGGGKSTLISKILEKYKEVKFSISYTSRPIRKGDIPGENYHFVSKEEFENLIKQDYFLEWAMVHDNYYGTPRKYIEEESKKGNKVLLDIDVQGFRIIKSKWSELYSIFILPPNEQIWLERLKNRGSETQDILDKRIRNGKEELKAVNEYDFKIINDDLNTAVKDLEKILFS